MDIEEAIAEKREFQSHPDGSFYKLPSFKVIAGKGLEKTGKTIDLPMVRGTRITAEGKEVFSIQGTTVESLLAVVIYDLEEKGKILESHENWEAIKLVQLALGTLESRQRDRAERNVLATNKK